MNSYVVISKNMPSAIQSSGSLVPVLSMKAYLLARYHMDENKDLDTQVRVCHLQLRPLGLYSAQSVFRKGDYIA